MSHKFYISAEFEDFLSKNGVKHIATLPYLPVYNAQPCIMRTLIFGTFFFEKKFVIKNQRNQKPKPTLGKHACSVSTV